MKKWYVLRDLRRANAKETAYMQLQKQGLEVFTPLQEKLTTFRGKTRREISPVIKDLLFVYEDKSVLDSYVLKDPALQYRYQIGCPKTDPMTVPEIEMDRFIKAVSCFESPKYYMPENLTPTMIGKRVKIVGGPLDGYEGNLLSVRGSKKRKILVEIPTLLVAAVTVEPEFIELKY